MFSIVMRRMRAPRVMEKEQYALYGESACKFVEKYGTRNGVRLDETLTRTKCKSEATVGMLAQVTSKSTDRVPSGLYH